MTAFPFNRTPSRIPFGSRLRPLKVAAKPSSNGVPPVPLKNGVPVDGPDLTVNVDGLTFPNPFVTGSGPPGTNYAVMKRAFEMGWGGVICKTLSLDSSKIKNVIPRYAQNRSKGNELMGWENIELISDLPLEAMLDDLKRLRDEFPDRIIFASIMEQPKKEVWDELVEKVEATGIDGMEINFSCPHGMPEMQMGMSTGQNPVQLKEICEWIVEKASVPVWAKMTPNIADIREPSREALRAGCSGIAAINTITSVMGIDLDTLRPLPSVEGYTTLGGYSFKAVKPIALAHVQKCATLIREEFDGKKSLSGIGGIDTGFDAAEFLLLGANTVQVCTGVMVHGYRHVETLCAELQAFMTKHGFSSVEEFRGAALPYFTTHAELVRIQKEAREEKQAAKRVLTDADWTGDEFEDEARSMVSN